MNITEFLEARITEDEAYAAQAQGESYGWIDNWRAETMQGTRTESVIYAHAFRFSPDRLLAECAAKRAIIARREDALDTYAGTLVIEDAIRALAAIYKDHPDYREEWTA